MSSASDIQVIAFTTSRAFEQWIHANVSLNEGIWIKFAKKASGIPSITYREALDVALCHGWIDGQVKSIDALFYRQRFTPRRPRSLWSKRNTARVGELAEAGSLKPAGLAAIEAAKNDGRWAAAYDSPSTIQVSADFQSALSANPKAHAFFSSLSRSATYSFLHRLQTLKRQGNRAALISDCIRLLSSGRPPPSPARKAAPKTAMIASPKASPLSTSSKPAVRTKRCKS